MKKARPILAGLASALFVWLVIEGFISPYVWIVVAFYVAWFIESVKTDLELLSHPTYENKRQINHLKEVIKNLEWRIRIRRQQPSKHEDK